MDETLERNYATAIGGKPDEVERALKFLALAESDEFGARALTALRACEAVSGSDDNGDFEKRSAELKRVERYANVLLALEFPPAVPVLLDLWRKHPAEDVRVTLEVCFVGSSSATLLEPVAETVDAYANGTVDLGTRLATAVNAIFAINQGAAYDRVAKYFARAGELRADEIAAEAFQCALRGCERSDADPRWRDLAVNVLAQRDDAIVYSAMDLLTRTRDGRAAEAITALLPRDVVELADLVSALERLGDRSVVPRMRAEAKRRQRRRREAELLSAAADRLDAAVATRGRPETSGSHGAGTPTTADQTSFPLGDLLTDGKVLKGTVLDGGARREGSWRVRVATLGTLRVPSGKLVACDPVCGDNAHPFTLAIAPGDYAVDLSVVKLDGSGDITVAAVVRVTQTAPESWERAATTDGSRLGYPVDSATGCFVDAAAHAKLFELQREGGPATAERVQASKGGQLIVDRGTGANVVTFRTGWGDGAYRSFIGRDSKGAIACIATDFGVVLTDEESRARAEAERQMSARGEHPLV